MANQEELLTRLDNIAVHLRVSTQMIERESESLNFLRIQLRMKRLIDQITAANTQSHKLSEGLFVILDSGIHEFSQDEIDEFLADYNKNVERVAELEGELSQLRKVISEE